MFPLGGRDTRECRPHKLGSYVVRKKNQRGKSRESSLRTGPRIPRGDVKGTGRDRDTLQELGEGHMGLSKPRCPHYSILESASSQ